MLSLDSVKTRTIYSKYEINSLEAELKAKLNEAYDLESSENISNLLLTVKLLFYLGDVPCLLKELNQVSGIQTLAQLEVLFMKCSQWKVHKEVMQKWVAALMKKMGKFVPAYVIKPLIAAIQFQSGKQESDIPFFALYLDKISQIKNHSTSAVSISFLRVFLIDQLQNKKRQLVLGEKDQILPEWKTILSSLLNLCHSLENLKYEQICVSICYWLCSQDQLFIKECVMMGMVSFLCQTLSNKSVSEWYGRKILGFLKLLLLGLNSKNEYFSLADIQSCIAQFTLKHFNENILQQARSLFSCIGSGQGKIEQQIQCYEKYSNEKNPKNLQSVIKSSRILFLYSEEQKIRKRLSDIQNIQYILNLVRKEQNVYLVNQILNIISYKSAKSRSQKEDDNDIAAIERISSLLSSSKDKNELLLNDKRLLISLIRMLKKLVQTRNFNQKLLGKIKSEGVVKKFSKFSDCTNFKYERELLSLIRVLNSPYKDEEKSSESADIMKALVKHMSENMRRTSKRLEDDLEQLELIYQMLQRGESGSINEQVIKNILRKIKLRKSEMEEVQISILDRSEEEGNRQLANRINYLAILCLQKLQSNNKSAFIIPKEDIDKLLVLGASTDDVEELKLDAGYLILLNENGKLSQEQKEKLKAVYRKYQQMVGQDAQLMYRDDSIQQNKSKEDQQKLNRQLVIKSTKQELSEEEGKQLEMALLSEEDQKLRKQWLQICSQMKQIIQQQSLTVILKFILKESKQEGLKKIIFDKFSKFFEIFLPKCNDMNTNLVYRILSELSEENLAKNENYFTRLLTISYEYFSKDSIEFTNSCLAALEYKGTDQRQDQYWKYIYNTPNMIGRESAYLIRDDVAKADKFWSFFGKSVSNNIEEQRKLTFHFLQLTGSKLAKQTWHKFQLQSVLLKLIEDLKEKNSEIISKLPSEALLRKLLRTSKAVKSIVSNQNLQLSLYLPSLYQNTLASLTTNPIIKSESPKINELSLEYTNILVGILKTIYRRRDGYSVVRKQLGGFGPVCHCISEYKNQNFNEHLLEIFRIMLLRDDRHEQFEGIAKMWTDFRDKITSPTTQLGTDHARACESIIAAVRDHKEDRFKKQYLNYFFPAQANQLQSALTFSDEQLLSHLKNLLNPPYQYGLNVLEKHLRLVQSSQFSTTLTTIFVHSQTLVKEDQEHVSKTLAEVQKTIADSIWGPGCQLNLDFYKMISMNVTGLRVCLRTKGLGVEGTKIVSEKFYEYPEQIPLCAQILHVNVATSKEWAIVLDKKIPQLVNSTYKSKGEEQSYGRCLANLVGSSSKLKAIQNEYKIQLELQKNLQVHSSRIACLASTLYALSGLVYLNDGNQKILGAKANIKKYLKVIEDNSTSPLIFEKGCNLLSNMAHKNVPLVSLYLQLQVERVVIKLATTLLYEYAPTKQFLRLVGNLSLSVEAASSIVRTQFLYLWGNILKEADAHRHEDIMKYCFDILFNLLNYPEVEAKPIAYKLNEAGCTASTIAFLQQNSLVTSIVEAGLDVLEKLLIVDVTVKQAIQSDILKCLENIAKTQSWNESVLDKWTKVLYALTRDQEAVKGSLLRCEVFGRLAAFIKQHPEMKLQTLQLVVSISDLVYQKANHDLFVVSGFIDLLAELLKNKYLKSVNASAIIDNLMKLHGEKVLNSGSYTKIFSGLMARLEFEFRDDNSKKIISAITKIRSHIQINTRAASILLQFSYIFLTQSEIITSQKYHKRVREFICLLSYFISLSVELKMIFREEEFIKILRSWIKVDKSLDEDNSVSEACRVCLFSIQNQQKFLVAPIDAQVGNEEVYNKLASGKKCLLYRRDHSNKDAIVRVRKTEGNMELVAYKQPDGEIKEKYVIPLWEVVGVRGYESSEDPLLMESVLSKPKTIFQKGSVGDSCATVIGVVGDELSVRQIDVEFENNAARDEFLGLLKAIISMAYGNSYRH